MPFPCTRQLRTNELSRQPKCPPLVPPFTARGPGILKCSLSLFRSGFHRDSSCACTVCTQPRVFHSIAAYSTNATPEATTTPAPTNSTGFRRVIHTPSEDLDPATVYLRASDRQRRRERIFKKNLILSDTF